MIRVLHGDCLALLPTLEADSLDCCVTDPPYHLTSGNLSMDLSALGPHGDRRPNAGVTNKGGRGHKTGFMGKQWDGGDIAFRPETWAEVIRVIRPGAFLLAFGGTRTYHRLACAIEDAGFEIRDTILWHFGQGFPKSLDVSRAIDRAAGAEREVVGPGTRHNSKRCAVAHGDTERLAGGIPDITAPATAAARQWSGWGTALKPATEIICVARKPLSERTVAGNFLRHGTGGINVDACRVEVNERPHRVCHSDSGNGIYGAGIHGSHADGSTSLGRWPANLCHDGSDEVLEGFPESAGQQGVVRGTEPSHTGESGIFGAFGRTAFRDIRGDAGSAARFFYSAKADADDRLKSKHPTVKPVDLMRWLVRLVTPPGGTILDPFAGSGTTAMAAMAEGFNAVLIEREAEYVADINRRLAHVEGADTPLFAEAAE